MADDDGAHPDPAFPEVAPPARPIPTPTGKGPELEGDALMQRLQRLEQALATLSARAPEPNYGDDVLTEQVFGRMPGQPLALPPGAVGVTGVYRPGPQSLGGNSFAGPPMTLAHAPPAGAPGPTAQTRLGEYLFPALARAGRLREEIGLRLAFLRELRLMAGMYLDSRYRLSRVAQFGVPGVLLLMVANYFVWPSIMLITPIGERLVLIALAIALYKILQREANRYGDVLNYLARYGGRH